MDGGNQLPERARSAIEEADSTIFVSAVSAYEIAFKHRRGKLDIAASFLTNYQDDLAKVGMVELAVATKHALEAGRLDLSHRDPFDRFLIAQARIEGLTLISNERIFDAFGVDRLWD